MNALSPRVILNFPEGYTVCIKKNGTGRKLIFLHMKFVQKVC